MKDGWVQVPISLKEYAYNSGWPNFRRLMAIKPEERRAIIGRLRAIYQGDPIYHGY